MKPTITIKLYDTHGDQSAKIETLKISEAWKLLREVEFSAGTIRIDYLDGMYNEANFLDINQAKLLLSVFRDKSLLDYIYQGGF
jgi:hypothetical protein